MYNTIERLKEKFSVPKGIIDINYDEYDIQDRLAPEINHRESFTLSNNRGISINIDTHINPERININSYKDENLHNENGASSYSKCFGSDGIDTYDILESLSYYKNGITRSYEKEQLHGRTEKYTYYKILKKTLNPETQIPNFMRLYHEAHYNYEKEDEYYYYNYTVKLYYYYVDKGRLMSKKTYKLYKRKHILEKL